mgnify:CR=1 FL=1
MNTATIIGRAGQDAEIKYFESGKVKTTWEIEVIPEELRILSESETPPFHIEENSKTKEEVTDWYNIEVWDKQAEFAGEYIKKGRQVVVDGRISISKWTDQTGEERERFLIVANNVRLLGSKRDAE